MEEEEEEDGDAFGLENLFGLESEISLGFDVNLGDMQIRADDDEGMKEIDKGLEEVGGIFLQQLRPPPPFEPDGPIRVLFLGVNTTLRPTINDSRESREICDEMHRVLGENFVHRIHFHQDYFTDRQTFTRKLQQFQPCVLHIACHGEQKGIQLFDLYLGNQELLEILKEKTLRLVVLNACDSAQTAQVISQEVDFAIGFNGDLGDDDACDFSKGFYKELASGRSLAEAFRVATQSQKDFKLASTQNFDAEQFHLIAQPKHRAPSQHMFAHIMVQQAPVLIATGTNPVCLRAIDHIKDILNDTQHDLPSGRTCLTDGKKDNALKCLEKTRMHVLVWSATGCCVVLQEGVCGGLAPPPLSEEFIGLEHVRCALLKLPEKDRPRIVFVCHQYGAQATAQLLYDSGVAGAVVWIRKDLIKEPMLLDDVILRICSGGCEGGLGRMLRVAAASSVLGSSWESNCGSYGEYDDEMRWEDVQCEKRSVETYPFSFVPPGLDILVDHVDRHGLLPLSFDIRALENVTKELTHIVQTRDLKKCRVVHVLPEVSAKVDRHTMTRCRAIAGHACIAIFNACCSQVKGVYLVQSREDIETLRRSCVSSTVNTRGVNKHCILIWVDLTDSVNDELKDALEALYKAFPRTVALLTSVEEAYPRALKISQANIPIADLRAVRVIPGGLQYAHIDSLHEEIRFRFLRGDAPHTGSRTLQPLETYGAQNLWLAVSEVLVHCVQQEHHPQPVVCLYQDDDASLLVHICVCDVGYLHVLRDKVLLGVVESHLQAHLNNTPGVRLVGNGPVQVEADRTHFAEQYDSIVLHLQHPTGHQLLAISKCKDRDVHIIAPAGAGKTFIALHLVLRQVQQWLSSAPSSDSSSASSSEAKVLFVANNKGMALYFAKWLCSRICVQGYNVREALKRALSHLHFMFAPFNKGPLTITLEHDDDYGGQVLHLGTPRRDSIPESYTIVVVDEAHHIYDASNASFRDDIDKHVPWKPREGTQRILLSDQSQSHGRSIAYPEGLGDGPIMLTEVVRCTKRIVCAAMSFELPPGQTYENETRCQHEAVGPKPIPYMFRFPDGTREGTPGWFEVYAGKVVGALERFVWGVFPGMSVDDRLAVLVRDEEFLRRLEGPLRKWLEPRRVVLESAAVSACRVTELGLCLGHAKQQQQQRVVLDTVDEFDGLERLIVVVVGLDSRGSASKNSEDVVRRETRSRIYRAVTRAHMQVILVNEFVNGGWFEFLGFLGPAEVGSVFDEETEIGNMKHRAVKDALAGKFLLEDTPPVISLGVGNSAAPQDAHMHAAGGAVSGVTCEGEGTEAFAAHGDALQQAGPMDVDTPDTRQGGVSERVAMESERVGVSVDTFMSNVWDGSACDLRGMDLRGKKPVFSPYMSVLEARRKELEKSYRRSDWLNVSGAEGLRGHMKKILSGKSKFLQIGVEKGGSWSDVASLLFGCVRVEKLDLESNLMANEGAQAIAPALGSMTGLQALRLERNEIEDDGAWELGAHLGSLANLQTLVLSSNLIGQTGMEALAEALPSLTCLQLLDLNHNLIGPAGAKALARALGSMTGLRSLDLMQNKIGKEGVGALAGALGSMSGLRSLNLNLNNMGVEGARSLAGALGSMRGLRELDLGINKIGDEGVTALAGALGSMTGLNILSFFRNGIGLAGAQALARALGTMTSLNDVNMGQNKVGYEGWQVLMDVRQSLPNRPLILITDDDGVVEMPDDRFAYPPVPFPELTETPQTEARSETQTKMQTEIIPTETRTGTQSETHTESASDTSHDQHVNTHG